MITESGFNIIRDLFTGRSSKVFSATAARIAIGNSSTAATTGDTALVSETIRIAMDAGYPANTPTKTVSFQAVAQSADALSHWVEFGIFNSSGGGTLLDRIVSDKGTKSSGEVWTIKITQTFSG